MRATIRVCEEGSDDVSMRFTQREAGEKTTNLALRKRLRRRTLSRLRGAQAESTRLLGPQRQKECSLCSTTG